MRRRRRRRQRLGPRQFRRRDGLVLEQALFLRRVERERADDVLVQLLLLVRDARQQARLVAVVAAHSFSGCAAARRVLGLQVAALQAWLPSFSHGWPVNSELKLSTAYEVHPALVTAHSSSFASLSIFLQQR